MNGGLSFKDKRNGMCMVKKEEKIGVIRIYYWEYLRLEAYEIKSCPYIPPKLCSKVC